MTGFLSCLKGLPSSPGRATCRAKRARRRPGDGADAFKLPYDIDGDKIDGRKIGGAQPVRALDARAKPRRPHARAWRGCANQHEARWRVVFFFPITKSSVPTFENLPRQLRAPHRTCACESAARERRRHRATMLVDRGRVRGTLLPASSPAPIVEVLSRARIRSDRRASNDSLPLRRRVPVLTSPAFRSLSTRRRLCVRGAQGGRPHVPGARLRLHRGRGLVLRGVLKNMMCSDGIPFSAYPLAGTRSSRTSGISSPRTGRTGPSCSSTVEARKTSRSS